MHKCFKKLGYLIISERALRRNTPEELCAVHNIQEDSIPVLKSGLNGGLKVKLIKEKKTKWLEIGCGGTFDPDFTYIDVFPENLAARKGRYFRMDIINLTESDTEKLGRFDFIRMQHVFEHFSPENGLQVLNNCARLLNPEGYILMTTPDLRKYISMYLNRTISKNSEWALRRIQPDSPDSFFFSVYAHSLNYEKHEWCYDAEGLIYQLTRTQKFKNIREIVLGDELANIPFTHNRPKEDVCIIGQLI